MRMDIYQDCCSTSLRIALLAGVERPELVALLRPVAGRMGLNVGRVGVSGAMRRCSWRGSWARLAKPPMGPGRALLVGVAGRAGTANGLNGLCCFCCCFCCCSWIIWSVGSLAITDGVDSCSRNFTNSSENDCKISKEFFRNVYKSVDDKICKKS